MNQHSQTSPVASLLVVDDTLANLQLLMDMLSGQHYEVRAALNGKLALGAVAQRPPDLILLDIKMPDMDGYEVCRELKRRPESRDIPVIFISALDNSLDKVRAFETGGVDYITKPFEATEVLARVQTHLTVARATRELEQRVTARTAELAASEASLRRQLHTNARILETTGEGIFGLDLEGKHSFVNPAAASMLGYTEEELLGRYSHSCWHRLYPDGNRYPEELCPFYETLRATRPASGEENFIRKDGSIFPVNFTSQPLMEGDEIVGAVVSFMDITEHKRSEQAQQESNEQLQRALKQTIQAVATTVEWRDPYTAGHQRHVSDLSAAIAEEMGLEKSVIEGIRMGATIHDIGKVSVPAEILTRPGKLNKHEFDIIKKHAEVGYQIIKDVDFPWPVADIVHQHHERLDGSGYPQGLKGDEIILEARIMCVADVVEAMASHRPYRPGLGIESALEEISAGRGKIYDADVVDTCLRLFHEHEYTLESA